MTEMIDPRLNEGAPVLVQHVDESVRAELKKAEEKIAGLERNIDELKTALANVRADRTVLQHNVEELTRQARSAQLEAALYRNHNAQTVVWLRQALSMVEGKGGAATTDSPV